MFNLNFLCLHHAKFCKANLKDFAWLTELMWAERDQSLVAINARLADNLVSINGKLEFPREFALNRLAAPN